MNTSHSSASNLEKLLSSDLSVEILNYLGPKKLSLSLINTSCNRLFREKNLISSLLVFIAHGNENKAMQLLTNLSHLSLEVGDITDYSGRTFQNITAYEYAYWSRDWYMLNMLALCMTREQKITMLDKINALEQNGLTYTTPNGETKTSQHFSLQPLIDAYNSFIAAYTNWGSGRRTEDSYNVLNQAWLAVGLEQSNLPAWVIQEYCRRDQSFHPRTEFNDLDIPRTFVFYNYNPGYYEQLFPVSETQIFRLGYNIALSKGTRCGALGGSVIGACHDISIAEIDLLAIKRLDAISNDKISENLQQLSIASDSFPSV